MVLAGVNAQRISIHALREEGDARGPSRRGCRSISIHALREEGDVHRRRRGHGRRISIHALREEGDNFTRDEFECQCKFLSTPSARRATS